MKFALGPAEAAVERGHYNYVLVQDSLLKEVVPILPFDAIDGVEGLCLPNNVIEYTYARVLAPAADALDDEFGVSCLDVAVFNGVEVALRVLAKANKFGVSPLRLAAATATRPQRALTTAGPLSMRPLTVVTPMKHRR